MGGPWRNRQESKLDCRLTVVGNFQFSTPEGSPLDRQGEVWGEHCAAEAEHESRDASFHKITPP